MDDKTLPGKMTDDSRFGDNLVNAVWNWSTLSTARLFAPYAWPSVLMSGKKTGGSKKSWGGKFSDLNLRNMTSGDAGYYFLMTWIWLPAIWLQSVVMGLLSIPFYPVAWVVAILQSLN